MARYIDADIFVRLIKEKYRFNDFLSANSAQKIIDNIPTTDVAPIIHAHWTYEIDDLFPADSMMICSNCGEYERLGANDNYCGNCGAKMDEEVE